LENINVPNDQEMQTLINGMREIFGSCCPQCGVGDDAVEAKDGGEYLCTACDHEWSDELEAV
jgi:hypothetical protein